jgi:uncharacterized protein YdeI (YjbR/CyaY-like superfamily)
MAAPACVVFFESPEAFRAWLAAHAHAATEIVVGFHKVGSGRVNMTWPASVDEALCVGWVDGVRKRIDEHTYQIRFTPRKPSSTWSAINIERVRVLSEAGRMTPAGIAAFAHRREAASRTYAYEQAGPVALAPADAARFRKNRAAWAFFEAQPPGYRKQMIWRVLSAKQQATRDKRLAALIEASAKGQRVP